MAHVLRGLRRGGPQRGPRPGPADRRRRDRQGSRRRPPERHVGSRHLVHSGAMTQTQAHTDAKRGALVVLAATQFLMVLDQAVMNVSISQLCKDFDTSVTT